MDRTAAAVYLICGRACAAAAAQRPHVMRRKLFILMATVSLVVCIAAGVLWVRSYLAQMTGPMVAFDDARGTVFRAVRISAGADGFSFVGSAPGRVLYIRQSGSAPVDASHCGVFGSPGSVLVYSPPQVVQGTGFLGFGHASRTFPAAIGGRATVISVPFWAVIVVTLALPLFALRRRLRDRRWSREGRCRACGYDLRASPDRCPECGAVSKAQPATWTNPASTRSWVSVRCRITYCR